MLLLMLGGCAGEKPVSTPIVNTADAKALIDQALPRNISDRGGWTADIYGAFTVLTVTPTRENICAVVAVIAQESGFRVDPVIPGLGAIARKEIDSRASRAHVPLMLVNGVLQLKSSDGRTYGERIDAARTEKDLSDAYEDFIAAVPLGKDIVRGPQSHPHPRPHAGQRGLCRAVLRGCTLSVSGPLEYCG